MVGLQRSHLFLGKKEGPWSVRRFHVQHPGHHLSDVWNSELLEMSGPTVCVPR